MQCAEQPEAINIKKTQKVVATTSWTVCDMRYNYTVIASDQTKLKK